MIRLILTIAAVWLLLDVAILVVLSASRRRERRLATRCAERVIGRLDDERREAS